MEKVYSVNEKVFELIRMSITTSEKEKINNLCQNFTDEELDRIDEVNDMYFKIGFRVASEILLSK